MRVDVSPPQQTGLFAGLVFKRLFFKAKEMNAFFKNTVVRSLSSAKTCRATTLLPEMIRRFLSVILLTFIPLLVTAQPVINSITPFNTVVEQYGKFEARVNLSATFTNPYDYEQVAVSAIFSGPGGQQKKVDGFYMIDYNLNKTNGSLMQVGSGEFRIRFAPHIPGQWTYTVSVTTPSGNASFAAQQFTCTGVFSSQNKGFIRSNKTNYLSFDNGEQYIAVGLNMAWQSGNIYTSFNNWLSKLADNGGNFIRLWHAHWGLGIEWQNGNNGFEGLRRYKQSNCFYQDWMFDFCAEKGIYIMLTLQHHGQVSSQVNPNWNESPYNSKNGGPCVNTWDFFTNEIARNHTKNRYRYILARWGYSRAILTWELFNEVEWTDQFSSVKNNVANWHYEMAAYLKKNDPYSHPVTTSYAHDQYDPQVWAHPDIDITQTHYYIGTSQIQRALANGVQKYLTDFGKPTLNGEFGLNTTGSGLSSLDPDGIHLHNCYWGSLFGGAMGTGMSWWWDNYIDPRNLWYHFAPISKVKDQVRFMETGLAPTTATWTGPTADLEFVPLLGWSALGDPEVTVNSDGTLTPANFSLATFLYGAQWNTQFRRPPTFHVTMPKAGQFKVRTSGNTGQAPQISIYLNGALVLQQTAQVNATYSINVPAGKHSIKVDNTGTDWITIASYSISELGKAVDAYVLSNPKKDYAAGWVLNKKYNHQDVVSFGVPSAVSGVVVTFTGMMDGTYLIRYFNPTTGSFMKEQKTGVTGGLLNVPLDPFVWDIAFTAEKATLHTTRVNSLADFKIYPNLVDAGSQVQIEFATKDKLRMSLLDMTGREIHDFGNLRTVGNNQKVTLSLPSQLPAGIYWIKLYDGHFAGAKPLVVR